MVGRRYPRSQNEYFTRKVARGRRRNSLPHSRVRIEDGRIAPDESPFFWQGPPHRNARLCMEMNMLNQHPSRKMPQRMEYVVPEPQTRRLTRSSSLSQFVCLSLLLSSLLLMGIPAPAQEPSNAQAQETNQQSCFLGDYYSKLQPDPTSQQPPILWDASSVKPAGV